MSSTDQAGTLLRKAGIEDGGGGVTLAKRKRTSDEKIPRAILLELDEHSPHLNTH